MFVEIETVPPSAAGHEDTVTISYSAASDRFCVISKTAIAAVDMLLASALDHVRMLKYEIADGEVDAAYDKASSSSVLAHISAAGELTGTVVVSGRFDRFPAKKIG